MLHICILHNCKLHMHFARIRDTLTDTSNYLLNQITIFRLYNKRKEKNVFIVFNRCLYDKRRGWETEWASIKYFPEWRWGFSAGDQFLKIFQTGSTSLRFSLAVDYQIIRFVLVPISNVWTTQVWSISCVWLTTSSSSWSFRVLVPTTYCRFHGEVKAMSRRSVAAFCGLRDQATNAATNHHHNQNFLISGQNYSLRIEELWKHTSRIPTVLRLERSGQEGPLNLLQVASYY